MKCKQRMPVVLDTCVILDMFLEDRNRHAEAKVLLEKIVQNRTKVRIPFSGLFEIFATLKRLKAKIGRLQFDNNQDGIALEFNPIAVDNAFFDRYYDSNLPTLKAGDLLFFVIAKTDGCDLITEDNEMYKKSKEAGLSVYRIKEYLQTVVEQ